MKKLTSVLTAAILSSTLTFNVVQADCGPDQYSRYTLAADLHKSLGGGQTSSSSVKESDKVEKTDTVTYNYTVRGSNASAIYKMTFLCERINGSNFTGAYLKSINVINWNHIWD